MSLLDRIHEAKEFYSTGLIPFEVAGYRVGHADPAFASALSQYPDVFAVSDGVLHLSPDLVTLEERSHAVARVLRELHAEGMIPGWRNELYPVFTEPGGDLLHIERAAATLFGIKTIAVNLNGYLNHGDRLSIWLQRRAMTKPISPGKLDVLVSGGLPANGDPFENLIRECDEEAGIDETLARQSVFAGSLDYRTLREDGVHHGHYLNYDLALPANFTPDNQDGEVTEFLQLEAQEVMDILSDTHDVAFDSALVIIDFLLRHGAITSSHPESNSICKALYG